MRRVAVISGILLAAAAVGGAWWWAGRRPPDLVAAWRAAPAVATLALSSPAHGTYYPLDFAAPTFNWEPGTGDRWLVLVTGLAGRELVRQVVAEPAWTPDPGTWATLRAAGTRGELTLAVIAHRAADPLVPLAVGEARFATAPEKLGAPLFYRQVTLPFDYAVKHPDSIRWCVADLRDEAPPRIVLERMNACGNCHSFTADGGTLAMDVDYANDKGSYAVVDLAEETLLTPERIFSWSDYRKVDGVPTFGLLAQISPDGRYVVGTVKDRSIFLPKDDEYYSQLFFPIRGILCVHDREAGTFAPLPGADDPDLVQSNPSWSPDGKWIYFCRAPAVPLAELGDDPAVVVPRKLAWEFVEEGRPFRFDIYRVPFNGGAGGVAEAIEGASGNGRSNFFPRVSPDGRLLAFCRADNYMLLQPDSEIMIVHPEGGRPVRLFANTARMNSWHSWSPNSRWLVWATKARGPYTGLALARIDATGRSGPAIHLDRLRAEGYALNIPEFFNADPRSVGRIEERFITAVHHHRQGLLMLYQWDAPEEARRHFELALAKDPDHLAAHRSLGFIHGRAGRHPEAREHLERAVELDPDTPEIRRELAWLHLEAGDPAAAKAVLQAALERWPGHADLATDRAAVAQREGDIADAEVRCREVIALHPEAWQAHHVLGWAILARGDRTGALASFRRALAIPATETELALSICDQLKRLRPLETAVRERLEALVAAAPLDDRPVLALGEHHLLHDRPRQALAQLKRARELSPQLTWVREKIAELERRLERP